MKFAIVYCMANGKEIPVDAPVFSKREDAMAFKDRRNAQQSQNAWGFYAVNEVAG